LARRNAELSARVRWEIEQAELEKAETKEKGFPTERDSQLRVECQTVNNDPIRK